jgi:hypothetical protein
MNRVTHIVCTTEYYFASSYNKHLLYSLETNEKMDVVAYPISEEEDGPAVTASATILRMNEPEIVLAELIHDPNPEPTDVEFNVSDV